MRNEDIQQYFLDKKEIIQELNVINREINIIPTKNFIISVIGPRRAGKSYLLYDLILNKLKLDEKEYLFLNFEDAQLTDFTYKDILDAVSLHEELYGKKPDYLFLDEIQNIELWDKAVRTLYESKRYYIFVSGSSSKLLSKEIATSLRGRAITYKVLPLSFREFLRFKSFKFKKYYTTTDINKIKSSLRSYIQIGGFPDIVIQRDLRDGFFKDYLDLVVFRDVIERYNVNDISLIRYLIKSVISSFSNQFSINKVYNTLKSQGLQVSKNTLYNYVSYLEDSFFLFLVKKFSYKLKGSELSIPKVYLNDVGLINSLSSSFFGDFGKLIENVVFLELIRRNKEIYYWRNQKKEEVDFVVIDHNTTKLFQVCYTLQNLSTRERELRSLVEASEKLNTNELYVITWDTNETITYSGKKIILVPLWRWLFK